MYTLVNWAKAPSLVRQHPRPLSIVHGGSLVSDDSLEADAGRSPSSFPRLLRLHEVRPCSHFSDGDCALRSRFLLQCPFSLKFSVSYQKPSRLTLKVTNSLVLFPEV